MRRIILHAGFHKTGTTSLQQTLRANRAALRPDIRLVLRPGMKALCESARAYSLSREDYDLGLVKFEAALLLESLQGETAQTLIITSEDLSGHMPGRHGLHGYGAAPHLMRALTVAFRAVEPAARITLFFTTRAPVPWLRSCYAQHVRAARMVWDEADYLKRMKSSAELNRFIASVRDEVPDHTVLTAALEDHADRRLGLAEALLDHLELAPQARAALAAAPDRNAALPRALLANLLALNRSDLDDRALRKAKIALMKEAA